MKLTLHITKGHLINNYDVGFFVCQNGSNNYNLFLETLGD